MQFLIHYQERAVVYSPIFKRDDTEIVTDVVMTQSELEQMYDQFQIEDLMNRVGRWDDNGYMVLNDEEVRLENRIAYIVCEGNLVDYMQRHGLSEPDWNGVHPVGQT